MLLNISVVFFLTLDKNVEIGIEKRKLKDVIDKVVLGNH